MTGSRWLIWRYYAFRMTNSAGFYLPVAILFLDDQGFGPGFIGLSYAVFGFASVAAEIPTGYLGDLVGRRGSLAVGSTLRALVLVAYPFVGVAEGYLLLHVVWATGRAFRSGTVDAWLYEVLQARFDESEYARIEGRGSALLFGTSSVAALLGALLYLVNPAIPFLLNGVLALAGLPILYTFPAVGSDDQEVFGVRDAVEVLRLQVRRPEIRRFVAYVAVFHALFLVTRVFEQPALRAVGVPVAGFGLLYAAFKAVSAGLSSTAGTVEQHLGARGVFAALIPVYGLAYAAIAFVPLAVVPVLFVNRGLRVLTRPIRNQYLNDRIDDVGRATVLSGVAMAMSLVGALARIPASLAAQRLGPAGFLPWSGLLVAVCGLVLWLATSPVDAGRSVESGSTSVVASD